LLLGYVPCVTAAELWPDHSLLMSGLHLTDLVLP
jgi:hypothetical protein